MAASDNNILQQVITYNSEAMLPAFLNQNCFISEICNHEYENFDKKEPSNLGDTIGVALPQSTIAGDGLVVNVAGAGGTNPNPIIQNIAHLPVIGAANVSIAVSNQQRLFNMDKDSFWKMTGKAMISELGSKVEKEIAKHVNSSATGYYMNNPSVLAVQNQSGPTRFVDFTNCAATGSSALNSYQQLDQSMSDWITLGAPSDDHCMVLPTNYYSPIIGSGLNQFVPHRNEEIAHSWLVGEFGSPLTKYYRSNYLPSQIAGWIGQRSASVANGGNAFNMSLTVVSVSTVSGTSGATQITATINFGALTPPANGTVMLRAGDLGYFDIAQDAGTLNAVTFYGHMPTSQQVQFRVLNDVAYAGSSTIVFQIISNTHTENQGLVGDATNPQQNINRAIVAGDVFHIMPSHKCGLRVCGKAFYVAIPRLDDENPYHTSVETDDETKVSLRMYYGALFGQNQKLLVNDVIWGALLLPRYCQRVCLPLGGPLATT